MKTIADATWELFGRSTQRAKAAAAVNRHAQKAAAKTMRRPPTLATAMVAIRATAARGRINAGARRHSTVAAAREIYRIAKLAAPETPTHAALKGFAKLFAATVVSKAGGELDAVLREAGGGEAAAINALAQEAPIPDVEYRQFGVKCRNMSKTWRDIKTAAVRNRGAGI